MAILIINFLEVVEVKDAYAKLQAQPFAKIDLLFQSVQSLLDHFKEAVISRLLLHQIGSTVNGFTNACVSTAAAEIGMHQVDVFIARIGIAFQQVDGGHDLTSLTVPTLRYVFF